jgi:hypothetical protein
MILSQIAFALGACGGLARILMPSARNGSLGTTALADIGTVEEQDERHTRWLDSRRTNKPAGSPGTNRG